MSIGDTDSRTDGPLTGLLGRAPGLFSPEAHNKYEIDGSLAGDDAYFANGQTTRFNGTRWARWRNIAGKAIPHISNESRPSSHLSTLMMYQI